MGCMEHVRGVLEDCMDKKRPEPEEGQRRDVFLGEGLRSRGAGG